MGDIFWRLAVLAMLVEEGEVMCGRWDELVTGDGVVASSFLV